jgi:hypothetical protein
MKVHGYSWGLSCNSVHFIDYFDRLIGGLSILKVSNYNLDKILESNRAGYSALKLAHSLIKTNENRNRETGSICAILTNSNYRFSTGKYWNLKLFK